MQKRAFFVGVIGLFYCVGGPSVGWCSGDLDRQFRLDTVGVLRSIDNVGGFFAEYVSDAFEAYFSQPGRFVLVDLHTVDQVISRSKLPYKKVIFDHQLLKQMTQSTHAESLIRTRVQKTGSAYFFTLEWLHAPKMEVIADVQFTLEEPRSGGGFERDLLSEKLKGQLSKLLHQLPFFGQVTGRDRESVTLNIGGEEGLNVGDQLELATVDEARRHPLMNRIVDWKMRPTGRVVVEKIDGAMAFCHLASEEPGMAISRFQKVIRLERSPGVTEAKGAEQTPSARSFVPRLGWMSLSLPVGSFSRLLSANSGTVSNQGGGFSLGAQADAELWLTRSWFLGGRIGYQAWTFTQKNLSGSQSTGVPGSDLIGLVNLGYSVDLSEDLYGLKGWLKVGFKSNQTQLPTSSSEYTGPMTLNSFFVGVGGKYPFLENWTAFADVKFRVLSFGSLDQTAASSSSDFNLSIGGTYNLNSRIAFRAGLEYQSSTVSLSSGKSVDQKMITIAPALLYSF